MATQSVEFRAATGLTITAKLFSAGSDTQAASVSATEATNRKGTYLAAFTSVAAGEYVLIAFDTTPIPVASWWVTLTNTTATFQVYEKADSLTIADAVWNEPYNQHTTAGTFGKLLDTIRKANLTIDGVVSNAITPTTLTFASDVVATTSAYAHAVLLFVSGPLEGENSPIISYTSTNGVFVLEEPLTAAPSDGDEFVVVAGSHVHSIADIAAGIEQLPIMVTPVVSQTPVRVIGQNISTFIGDLSTITVGVFSGSDPVDLSGFGDLEVCVQARSGVDLDFVPMADLTISGTDNNYVSWDPAGPSVADVTRGKWSLRKTSNKQVIAYGAWIVEDAALEDTGS